MPKSYIHSIDVTSYKKEEIENILKSFGKLQSPPVVLFKGKRPIFIYEDSKINEKKFIAIATSFPLFCIIKISPNLKHLELVLLHEYVHCFGITHVDKVDDLMYPEDMEYTDPNSVLKYSEIIRKKLYGK